MNLSFLTIVTIDLYILQETEIFFVAEKNVYEIL